MQALRIRGYHPLWPDFPDRSAQLTNTTGLLRFRSPLLAQSRLMSLPPGTEMFQFPGFASNTYGFSAGYPKRVGCPIRTPRDQRLLAAPPRFSQRATSFIASWRQGIHQMPFSCSIHRSTKTMPRSSHRIQPISGQWPGANGQEIKLLLPTHTSTSPDTTELPNITDHNRLATGQWPPASDPELSRTSRNATEPDSQSTKNTNLIPEVRPQTSSLRSDLGQTQDQTTATNQTAPLTFRPLAPGPQPLPATTAMETDGFEPTTPCLQSRCSPS
jgi:hypothetical protein